MAKPPATYTLEFRYKRSVGPVVGTFLTGLRERRIRAVRTEAGRVLVPPLEYDPETGDANPDDWQEVGPGGVVEGFTWTTAPGRHQPLDHPFAWVLVKLDGADTALLHALDAGAPERVHVGLRVRPRWAAERQGHITDIVCFEPEDA